MAKSSFGKGFTREFRPGTVGNMFLQNLFVRQRQKERRDYLDQKEKERLDRINAIERKDASLMGQLRSATQPAGGVGTPLPEFQIPLNQKQLGNVYGQLSDKGQQRFNNLERFNQRFLQEKDEFINLNYSRPEAVYGFNKRTQQVEKVQDGNPIYDKPNIKRESTTTGFNRGGRKQVYITYDDGSSKTIDTPFFKQGGKEIFDYNEYNNTTFPKYNKEYARGNNAIDAFLTKNGGEDKELFKKKLLSGEELIGAAGNYINKTIDEAEVEFYNSTMPEAQAYINRHYFNNEDIQGVFSGLGESGIENPEYVGRQDAKNEFLGSVERDWVDKTLDIDIDWANYPTPKGVDTEDWRLKVEGDIYKSVILWAKLKMDRL